MQESAGGVYEADSDACRHTDGALGVYAGYEFAPAREHQRLEKNKELVRLAYQWFSEENKEVRIGWLIKSTRTKLSSTMGMAIEPSGPMGRREAGKGRGCGAARACRPA
jgi:hypothetical protein